MTLKVGDIIICHNWDEVEGKKGFIEEIISDPKLHKSGKVWTGRFAVYGIEEADFDTINTLYFGDFFGADLEETGESMTEQDLKNYMNIDPEDKMMQQDIPIMIKNLGRELGKNEGKTQPLEKIYR